MMTRMMLPNTFVVLQGIPGDGAANTMDDPPRQKPSRSSRRKRSDEKISRPPSLLLASMAAPFLPLSAAASLLQLPSVVIEQQADNGDDNDDDQNSSEFIVVEDKINESRESWAQSDEEELFSAEAAEATAAAEVDVLNNVLPVEENSSYCNEHPDNYNEQDDSQENSNCNEWRIQCREKELQHRKEWLSLQQSPAQQQQQPLANTTNDMWWLCADQGYLAVFEQIPTLQQLGEQHQQEMQLPIKGSLAPGTTIVGTKVLQPIILNGQSSHSNNSQTDPISTLQILQIESPMDGYIVSSIDNYQTVLPGLPAQYTDPNVWLWRVTCLQGAVVRQGLDLISPQVNILPYGSIVQVTRKTINAMGLSRLQVVQPCRDMYFSEGNESYKPVVLPEPTVMEGWCSEFLNPLSGQRGSILQPLPLPCPARYRITLGQGAVIRSGMELSSPQIGVAPQNAIVTVTRRCFSEHPMDRCIERLQLAGNGGWISCRLNKRFPEDSLIVECVGLDPSFDPNEAGRFHIQATAQVKEQQHTLPSQASVQPHTANTNDQRCVTRFLDDHLTMSASAPTLQYSSAACTQASSRRQEQTQHDSRCLICLSEDRSATLIHGETGHIACCLMCARIIKARNDPCPVCRLPIDLVIQHFWA
jgi:hypothetical protein